MPKRFALSSPDVRQREKILSLVRLPYNTLLPSSTIATDLSSPELCAYLRHQMLQDVSLSPNLSLRKLAEYADGQSGSDLKELCRNAAMMPVREYVRNSGGDPDIMRKAQEEVRSLSHHSP